METKRGSNSGARWIQRGVIAIAVVALLAGAAYMWGNRLSADTLPASSQRAAEASASSYGSLRGMSAVRALDAAAALSANASASRWAGLGAQYQKLNAANLQRGLAASAARWTALGAQHEKLEAANLQRGLAASAARWTALGEHYQKLEAAQPAMGVPLELGQQYLHEGASVNMAALKAVAPGLSTVAPASGEAARMVIGLP